MKEFLTNWMWGTFFTLVVIFLLGVFLCLGVSFVSWNITPVLTAIESVGWMAFRIFLAAGIFVGFLFALGECED